MTKQKNTQELTAPLWPKNLMKAAQAALLKVAKNMLKQGLSIQDVITITGLSERDISKDI